MTRGTARSIRVWAEGLWVMVIRIGTWNLENLFKPPNPFAPKTEEEYQAKLDALASAITRMDPHVLAVQEVGDPVALGELADRVGGTGHMSRPRYRYKVARLTPRYLAMSFPV